jgi:hypothetical protein
MEVSSNSIRTNADWIVVEDDFVSVYCLALPWVGTSLFMAPLSQLSDGVLYLVKLNSRLNVKYGKSFRMLIHVLAHDSERRI